MVVLEVTEVERKSGQEWKRWKDRIEEEVGPFVLSSVGPFIRFICSEGEGGTAGKSGAGCGMCPRMAFHHLQRQLLVMGPPGPTLLAFARYFPLAMCHAGLFGPAQMTASAWARRSEVWGLLPLQLGHPPYVRVQGTSMVPLVPHHAEQESDHFLNAILIMSPISFFGLFGLCLGSLEAVFPVFSLPPPGRQKVVVSRSIISGLFWDI